MANLMEIMQVCRLCLVKEQVNVPIFKEQGDVRQIFLKIAACLPVKVSRDDNLPKKICDGCLYKVELLYQFWNTTANAEKQLLAWLAHIGIDGNSKTSTQPLPMVAQSHAHPHSLNPETVILKQEAIDPIEVRPDLVNVSSDTQNYILQQQQLPYQPVGFPYEQPNTFAQPSTSTNSGIPATTNNKKEAEGLGKRKRTQVITNPLPSSDDSDEEDSLPLSKIAKEEEDSDSGDDNEPLEPTTFVGVPSESQDSQQPGPSGISKPAAASSTSEAPSEDPLKANESMELSKEYEEAEMFSNNLLCAELPLHSQNIIVNLYAFHFVRKQDFIRTVDTVVLITKCSYDNVLSVVKTGGMPAALSPPAAPEHKRKQTIPMQSKQMILNMNAFYRSNKFSHDGVSNVLEHISNVTSVGRTTLSEILKQKFVRARRKRAVKLIYDCPLCSQKFAVKRIFEAHVRRDHPNYKNENVIITEKKQICELCGKELCSKASLLDHMKVHRGEKPEVCETCGKCFTKRTVLEMHIRVHTKEKPFVCKICAKAFTQRTSLTIHIRASHTGERPYVCNICGMAFVTRTLLKLHCRKHGTPLSDIK